jgi:hypothetical protein
MLEATMTELKRRMLAFGIEHTTLQFEAAACKQGNLLAVLPAAPKAILKA